MALELELFTRGSLNTFAKQTNVDTNNRLICYDILELGEQLRAIAFSTSGWPTATSGGPGTSPRSKR